MQAHYEWDEVIEIRKINFDQISQVAGVFYSKLFDGLSFGLVTERSNTSHLPSCYPLYGHIVDKHTRQNIPICGNRRMDNSEESSTTTLYVSRSNHLQIISNNNEDLKFIVRIEGYHPFPYS